jgi:hypothetical protein
VGDRPLNETNSAVPAHVVAPDDDDKAESLDGWLRALSEKLRARGLKAQLVRYRIDGIESKYYDAIKVTNPAAPERGTMQFEKEGWMTWEFAGTIDETGINTLADEATNALHATGVPFAQGPPS